MTPDKNQNINLLPADLQRKQQVVRQVISTVPVEYTAASNGKKPSRPGFFSRFSSGVKPAPATPAQPFSTKLPVKPTTPAKVQPPIAPKTDFLSSKPVAAKTDYASAKGGPPSGRHWWQGLFSKKSRKPTAVSTLKAQNIKPLAPLAPPAVAKPPVVLPVEVKPDVPPAPTPKPPVEPVKVTPTPTPPAPTASRSELGGSTPPPAGGDKSAPVKAEVKKKSSEIFDVNLLSGEYAQAFAPQNQKFIFVTAVTAAALVVVLGYAGAYLYQIKKEANTRQTALINQELTKTISSYAPLEAEDTALQKKVAGIKDLLAAHISFKDFLTSLEAATIPDVTYTAIAVAKTGEMSLTALATDYTALARQLAILQKDTPWVKSAIVTGATLARDNQAHSRGVEFEISIKVDPVIFKQTSHQ